MKVSRINHFIVAPTNWWDSGLVFRRHRIAEKLSKETSTDYVYWIYQDPNIEDINVEKIKDNIISIGTPSKKLSSVFLKSNKDLEKLILKKIPDSSKRMLWHTYPAYPELYKIKWSKVVYDCSDNWNELWENPKGINKVKESLKTYLIKEAETKVALNANHIFVTSGFLMKKLRKITSQKINIIQNGVDISFFNTPVGNELNNIPYPKVGFVGAIKKKIDIKMLYKFSIDNDSINLVLIGPISKDRPDYLDELLELKNVYYYEGVSIDKVPQFLNQLDVGLLPYKKIDYNKAVSPLKLFEYLSVGLPVAGSGVPETKVHISEGVFHYSEDEDVFSKEVKKLIKLRRDDKYIKARIKLAHENNWETKLDRIIEEVIDC